MPEIEQDDAAAETVDSSTVKFGTPEALKYVRSLTDVGAMTRLLHECIAYQRSLDSDLDALLSQRTELDRSLVQLQRSAEILDIVKADADHMLGNVRSTCDLADQVSGKVRELDLAQSRVNVTLSRIDAIVERGNCIEGVKTALESEDYESAAKFVQRFLQIDSQYKDSSGSDQREQLLASKKQLEGIVNKKLSAAINQRDHPTILRFPRHLNRILEVLVSHRGYLRKAFDLFKSSRLHGVMPNTRSYNILMHAFCLNDDLSIAYLLFGKMLERDVVPDVESYKILIQGFSRKGQVNGAMELLEDMLNKGFVPDRLSYTTLLNSLCRKTQLREAYKLLCRMKLKGCNPDIVHYNTMILGFCREGRAMDARKVLDDMSGNGCSANLISYRTLIGGLCDQGMYDEGKKYLIEMMSKGFSPHFSISNSLVKGFCSFGKVEEACDVVGFVIKNGETLHSDTWEMIIPLICKEDESEKIKHFLEDATKEETGGDTRIVDAGVGLGSYLSSKLQMKRKNVRERKRHTFF
ncbi:PREDICTED: pentatricopeptide repeat-containing protein At4g01400, mitochondrial-like [Camelina sativa]|uniref:Pentatricopeptide repeat-containing protein At4g01400, mitochondrial-like n=1 Tax=Camelina sativa TaxID=90675 RepID=A0ABM1QTU0_CAMSA|nr:PREDICTED: pentatricopeptide repeat-containing protein At4g01400, mitochondrial-like [Camelina sativa]